MELTVTPDVVPVLFHLIAIAEFGMQLEHHKVRPTSRASSQQSPLGPQPRSSARQMLLGRKRTRRGEQGLGANERLLAPSRLPSNTRLSLARSYSPVRSHLEASHFHIEALPTWYGEYSNL